MQLQQNLLNQQMSFLPEPKYLLRYPVQDTMAAKALRLLLTGAKVTHPSFEAVTGSWRLAAHVYILKKLGWPVMKTMQPLITEHEEGRKRNYDLYYLPADCIEMVFNIKPRGINPGTT
jgi:hypothetical protein